MVDREKGFTLAELLVGILLLGLISVSILTLFTTLIRSTVVIKRKAVASTIAITQMETLKSLPYNNLAVAGGPIYSTSYLPANESTTLNGVTYTTTTSVDYVDDAYDGCGPYPNQTLKQQYCRNLPSPTGAPATDTNPQDYKIARVVVKDAKGIILASMDSQIAARVAETASTTGALFVSVLDENGNPLSGATVNVTNTTSTPNINLNDTSDSNGIVIFYGLPPDTNNFDYKITGTLANYSSLSTIIPTGNLTPTYPNQKIFTQQSSFVTLTLKPQGQYSLIAEATDTTNNPLSNLRVYIKGGYKSYTSATNTAYYYDNMTPTDTRPTTDSSGVFTVTNLVPGNYIFCGDNYATNCRIGNTTYYLVAAVPYTGPNSFNPIVVPTYLQSDPPSSMFTYNGNDYVQKVRLIFSTNSSFPRVYTLAPDDLSLATANLSNFTFQVTGANLPCNANASNCSTTVRFINATNTYTASCTGNNSGVLLNCSVNLGGISAGQTRMQVVVGGNTLTIPDINMQGGLLVTN